MSSRIQPMQFFIGPCVLESRDLVFHIMETLKKDLAPYQGQIELIFKGSYDKANRTSIESYRGPGIKDGLKLLNDVKEKFQVKVVTDFHQPSDAMEVGEVVDFLQVPAFLCRQTDMIHQGALAAKKFARMLKVKKGQFLSPEETKNIVDKASTILPLEQILLTERGTSFGYNNLIVDMASFQIMKSFGVKTIFDATHAVQRPGGLGNKTGGKREQIKVLSMAAVASGCDGVFMECHPNPDQALSDASTSLPLSEIASIVGNLLIMREAYLKTRIS